MSTDPSPAAQHQPPTRLAHLPVHGGLAVPWITPTLHGRPRFGAIDQDRAHYCLRRRLCGVCGLVLGDRTVLLMRLSDLPLRCSVEPGLHPHCSHYTTRACPMIAGRLTHYRSHPVRGEDIVAAADAELRAGSPAEPWFAVWLDHYRLDTYAGHLVASYRERRPLRIRPVGTSVFGALFD